VIPLPKKTAEATQPFSHNSHKNPTTISLSLASKVTTFHYFTAPQYNVDILVQGYFYQFSSAYSSKNQWQQNSQSSGPPTT